MPQLWQRNWRRLKRCVIACDASPCLSTIPAHLPPFLPRTHSLTHSLSHPSASLFHSTASPSFATIARVAVSRRCRTSRVLVPSVASSRLRARGFVTRPRRARRRCDGPVTTLLLAAVATVSVSAPRCCPRHRGVLQHPRRRSYRRRSRSRRAGGVDLDLLLVNCSDVVDSRVAGVDVGSTSIVHRGRGAGGRAGSRCDWRGRRCEAVGRQTCCQTRLLLVLCRAVVL
jgi:hypothetical protein